MKDGPRVGNGGGRRANSKVKEKVSDPSLPQVGGLRSL